MTGKMNWRRAALQNRPSLDFRYEFDVPDRAAKWLRAVEHRLQQQQRITTVASSSCVAGRAGRSAWPKIFIRHCSTKLIRRTKAD
jgi:hypothetical protein